MWWFVYVAILSSFKANSKLDFSKAQILSFDECVYGELVHCWMRTNISKVLTYKSLWKHKFPALCMWHLHCKVVREHIFLFNKNKLVFFLSVGLMCITNLNFIFRSCKNLKLLSKKEMISSLSLLLIYSRHGRKRMKLWGSF